MCYKNETLKPINANGKFFDLFPESGHPMIMSYSRINREILVNEKTREFIWGDIKKKKELHSIHELRQAFSELIYNEVEIVNRHGTYMVGINLENTVPSETEIKPLPFRVNIQPEDREFIIDQLILDVLFSKYCAENPQMTLRQYSLSHGHYVWSGQKEYESRIESVRKCVSSAINKQIAIMNSLELRAEIEELGINPDEFFAYMSKISSPFLNGEKQEIHKKPKVIWDYIYYNANQKLISRKQYARSFSKNGNYSRADFVDLFNSYDQFVDELFMQPTENSKDYFWKSLDFYFLEIYKRLDFIYKLAVRLENTDSPVIDKEHPLVKRFHPYVCDVSDKDGSLKFSPRIMYYRPMLMLEELWQQKKLYYEPMYEDTLWKHHFIRAKVYEFFKYHFKFISDDYDEISDFIDRHYNILHYHESPKIWIQQDRKYKAEREARIIKALEINEALFGDSEKRNPRTWNLSDAT